jgi:ADP-heptose:LPS heptosyltransferase
LGNTSCKKKAAELLGQCLRGEPWDRQLLRELLREGCDDALFRVVAEGLSDRFEPRLCRLYDEIFSEALGQTKPPAMARPGNSSYKRVYVLSRVTLGADVAVTSVVLDAAKQRFPQAEIYLAGPAKNAELFAADPRIRHLPVHYRRGSLADRIAHLPALRGEVDDPDALVIDPDSRLTQLGLLAVCRPENYLFFESRSYGGDGTESLVELTARWCREVLDVEAHPYIAAPPAAPLPRPSIAVSLGVGENPNKRLADPFESELLRALAATGARIWIDAGAGGEEAGRVAKATAGLEVELCRGSFASFAALIQASDFYLGYDSAGQHVAAACGIPQATIFAGEPCERMVQRWRPTGRGKIHVLRAGAHDKMDLISLCLNHVRCCCSYLP